MASERDHWQKLSRRSFVKGSLIPVAMPLAAALVNRSAQGGEGQGSAAAGPEIIDTNVHLFDWPFRKLKYARTEALVAKLFAAARATGALKLGPI